MLALQWKLMHDSCNNSVWIQKLLFHFHHIQVKVQVDPSSLGLCCCVHLGSSETEVCILILPYNFPPDEHKLSYYLVS